MVLNSYMYYYYIIQYMQSSSILQNKKCEFFWERQDPHVRTPVVDTHTQLTLTLTRRCQCHPFGPLLLPPYRYNTAHTTPPASILAITYCSLRIRCRHVPIANVVVVRLLQLRRRRARTPRDMWYRRLNLSPFPLRLVFFVLEGETKKATRVSLVCYIDVSQDFVMISSSFKNYSFQTAQDKEIFTSND